MGVRLLVDGRSVATGDGFVFDLDGVLVDSESCWEIAEREAIGRLGGVLPVSREGIAGLSPRAAGELLASRSGLHGRGEELEALVEVIAADVFRSSVVAVAGAEIFLDQVRALGPVVVATNSPRDIALASLTASGLDRLIDVLVTVDEVGVGKPAPDLYLEACRRVGADPVRTVGVEDSSTGYRALLAAGLIPVVFGSLVVDGPPPAGRVTAWSSVTVQPIG